MNGEDFKLNFRVSRKTFNWLYNQLVCLEKQITKFRHPIPRDKRIAISLYTLGSSAELRTIGNLFGIGESTVRAIIFEFIDAIIRLLPKFINAYPPNQQKIDEIIAGFETEWKFIQVYGAVGKKYYSYIITKMFINCLQRWMPNRSSSSSDQ